jgi:hypothetical protein
MMLVEALICARIGRRTIFAMLLIVVVVVIWNLLRH